MKRCNKCAEEKELSMFFINKTSKDGVGYICKECESKRRKKHYLEHKDEELKKQRERLQKNPQIDKESKRAWYDNNKESHLAKAKQWRQDNPEYMPTYYRKWINKNKERKAEMDKKWRDNNKEHCRTFKRLQQRKRRREDPAYRLRCNVSRDINRALKSQNATKTHPTWSKLPYTPQQLKNHLESQFTPHMSWTNYGKTWEVDHIHPQSLLPYSTTDDDNFQKCWALNNLQPLTIKDNRSKSNKVA